MGFVCRKFPTILSRESGNCVFQNMEEEACRTPSLTKEWGKRSWAPSGRFTSIPLNRKSGQDSSFPRIYSAGNGFAFPRQDLKGASSVLGGPWLLPRMQTLEQIWRGALSWRGSPPLIGEGSWVLSNSMEDFPPFFLKTRWAPALEIAGAGSCHTRLLP